MKNRKIKKDNIKTKLQMIIKILKQKLLKMMSKINMKQKLKMIWQILRDKQSVVITESYGKLYYNWNTRSLEDVCQMCYKVHDMVSMMNNKK